MIAPTPYDRVQYTLSYQGTESLTIQEVKDWKNDDKEYARNPDYDGMFMKFSKELEFVGDGKDFINYIDEAFGIEAEIQIVKEERHPLTDVWTEVYFGMLDLSTLVYLDNSITIKMNSGGIEQKLKARESERIEVDRMETFDGTELQEIETNTLALDGRQIFLLSKMENAYLKTINTRFFSYFAPTQNKVITSDTHIISTLENIGGGLYVDYNPGDSTKTFPQRQQYFYLENDRTKTLQLTFDIEVNVKFNNPDPSNQYIRILIQKSKDVGNPEPEPVQLYDIIYINGSGGFGVQTLTYTNDPNPFEIEIQEGESLAVVWKMFPDPFNSEGSEVDIIKNDLLITEDSYFEQTYTRVILAHDLGQRISQIITDKDAFYSKDLGRPGLRDYTEYGKYEATGMAHGFWIREFKKDDDELENRFKPLTTSWKDFMEAMRVTLDMGVGIDFKGRKERLRMERKKFFYQPITTIKLPNVVNNIKKEVATEYYFSGIEAGYEKGGEYEESMGLDEYNGKSNFITFITRVKNIFKIVSPYRTDSYGVEFARRLTRRYHPTKDSRYDQDIFQFDLKRLMFGFRTRKWADDFETEPENVYSPETAFNLKYSPANLIFRHGWEIASSFIKYPLDFIRYGSSTANSKLKTKLIGKEEISENEDIQNNKLPRARFKPQWVNFEHECDFFVMKQVEGFTIVNGEEIPNFYGMVEYRINEFEVERGYLFNLLPNGRGNWKILRANI